MGIRRFIRSFFFDEELVNSLQKNIESVKERIDSQDRKNEYLFWSLSGKAEESMQDTKKRVFASLPKATGTLRDIQLAENAILRRVKEICDKNNLQISLLSGTALGAIRHCGFIPWDDDIDTAMKQEDFEVLEKILADDELLEVHRYYSPNGHAMNKVKFRFSKEIYIDILTYERFDADKSNAKVRWEETQEASKKIQLKINSELIRRGLYDEACIRPIYNDDLFEYIKEYKKTLCEEMPYYGHGDYIAMDIALGPGFRDDSWYFPETEVYPLDRGVVEFEGTRYDLWKNMDRFFERIYGDIWTFPKTIDRIHEKEFSENIKNDLEKLKELHII